MNYNKSSYHFNRHRQHSGNKQNNGSHSSAQLVKSRHTSLTSRACSTTSVKPLSCNDESNDGSWKTYTVTRPVARTNTNPLSINNFHRYLLSTVLNKNTYLSPFSQPALPRVFFLHLFKQRHFRDSGTGLLQTGCPSVDPTNSGPVWAPGQ